MPRRWSLALLSVLCVTLAAAETPTLQGSELGVSDSGEPWLATVEADLISEVRIEGNTIFTDAELQALLTLSENDRFVSERAFDDFLRLRERYEEGGYLISPLPDFDFVDGTYVQRIQEVRIIGYDIAFEDEPARTDETVITRHLPAVGSLYNRAGVRDGLLDVARLGIVEPLEEAPLIPDADRPDEAVVRILLRELPTLGFSPQLSFSPDTGVTAGISFGDANVFGLAHDVSAEVEVQSSPLGLLLGGAINYRIPWLYIDLLDFREVPTSVSASLFTLATPGRPLTDNGGTRVVYPGLDDRQANRVLIGSFTQRDSGVELSLGRPVLPDTSIELFTSLSYVAFALEPPSPECELADDERTIIDRDCQLPEELAQAFLPQSGLSGLVATAARFDNRDSAAFPREGFFADPSFGIGFGSDFRDPDTGEQAGYVFQQLELGGRTYLATGDPGEAVAFRINIGRQFGGPFPATRRFMIGDTPLIARQVRGYRIEDFGPSRAYLTASLEVRQDFGIETLLTETIVGIVFVDLGWASSVTGFDDYRTPLFASFGLGAQFDLRLGDAVFPPIRFDYGISERNPAGRVAFRIGPVF